MNIIARCKLLLLLMLFGLLVIDLANKLLTFWQVVAVCRILTIYQNANKKTGIFLGIYAPFSVWFIS